MQYLQYKKKAQWHIISPIKYLAITLICFFIGTWQVTKPLSDYFDRAIFGWLNGSLEYSHAWSLLWGYLNHPRESWLNVVWMVGVNILGIYTLPKYKRQHAWALVLYFWLAFQVVLFCTHQIFFDWLDISRWSPSLVVNSWVDLSQTLGIEELKVSSQRSFPAGHALVLVYWLYFTNSYCERAIKYLVWFTVVMLLLPRMISGAHWFTDIVFTLFYGRMWYELVIGTPLYPMIMARIEGLFAGYMRRHEVRLR